MVLLFASRAALREDTLLVTTEDESG